ncbi:G0/G1 switch protein 2-like [Onychostoma macrolepis]|uniref:G0/G1 switch protein 2-like n=1 Tax=Onychostoma macrolepis TaxID=369639 RepID=UPI00272D1882|nr:G0/G1 switch protein 2-like [Onychostoma macrolepis]
MFSDDQLTHVLRTDPIIMETLRELVPFIREVLSQKPSRGLLKVYLVGSVLAVLGLVLGLLELVFQPFSSEDLEMTRQDKHKLSETTLRSSANRIHAF